MARFGRRQPHAPILLRGGGPPSVAHLVTPRGGFRSQQQALFAHRPLFPATIKTHGPPPPVGRVVRPAGAFASQAAAQVRYHPQLRPYVTRPIVTPFVPPPFIYPLQRVVLVLRVAKGRAEHGAPLARIAVVRRPVLLRTPRPAKTLLPRVPDPDSPNFQRRLGRFTEILSSLVNSLVGQGFLVQTGPESWTLRGGAAVETRPPAATDDATQGYAPGMLWLDTATNTVYVNVRNTPNAAVWQ